MVSETDIRRELEEAVRTMAAMGFPTVPWILNKYGYKTEAGIVSKVIKLYLALQEQQISDEKQNLLRQRVVAERER